VAAVCEAYPQCCTTAWSYLCIERVDTDCGTDCGAGVVPCADQYAGAPSFVHCHQTPGLCYFQASDEDESCAQMCADQGGECLDAFDNDQQCDVDWGEHLGCDHVGFASVICICSRGCGVAEPCSAPSQCSGGQCS